LQQKTQTSGIGKPVQKFPFRSVATEIFGFPCNIGDIFFTSKRILFVLVVFSRKMYTYTMNKYLLSTPNQNSCYWFWEALKFLIRFGEPRDKKVEESLL
jgi:hypothetical protein